MSSPNKVYLGDSVYCEINAYGALVLTTWNGYPDDPRNRIILEPEVIEALQLYLRKMANASNP
jgi:hypothetical protein